MDGHAPVPECDIEQCRMVLSGWRFVQRAVWGRATSDLESGLPFERPEIMARALDGPKRPRFELRRFVDGYAPDRAAGRVPYHARRNPRSRNRDRRAISAAIDWVDADHTGDVLWSARGRLFRLAGPARRGMKLDAAPKLVADLNDMTFEAIEAPRRAMKWP